MLYPTELRALLKQFNIISSIGKVKNN